MNVPEVVIRRLPLYLRALTYLERDGQRVVSSTELGRWTGFSAAQIRRDLSHFGEFGTQGLGYQVGYLRQQLRAILHADRDWHLALIGAGALGDALAHYEAFRQWNFRVVAVFDNDPAKVGQELGGVTVEPIADLDQVVVERHVDMAIIAVPAESAQEVADRVVASGIASILSYAPINLTLPEHVRVAYIDPVTNLQSMSYYLVPRDNEPAL